MANPSGNTYLTANTGYIWANGDVYEIVQTDTTEGAATGASFSGLGVDNQPHQVLLNKCQWLYDQLTGLSSGLHGMQIYSAGSGNFTVPTSITALWVRGWGWGGQGGYGTTGYSSAGGGGGGGGYFEGILTVVSGQIIAYRVIPGAATAFGSWTATAGGAGQAASGIYNGAGGYPGGAGGAPICFPGTSGEDGRSTAASGSTGLVVGGEGGASFGCGHSHFAWANQPTNGSSGMYPGQGGGGGIMGGAGGAGSPGMIIVVW